MSGNATGGTLGSRDVTTGLSEAVMEADAGKKSIPSIDAGTAAVDYAAQQSTVPASVVHVDFRGEAARDLTSDSGRNKGLLFDPRSDDFAEFCKSFDQRSLGYRLVKRAFDVAFSGVVCLIGLIPGALLCTAIAMDTKGSPIYSQIRVGKHGKPFRIYKFRSMVADSDDVEKYFTSEQIEVWKRERKVDNDPRITKLGRLIRKTSIDELPQFVNVFLGQISVIGPRPITYEELEVNFSEEQAGLLLSIAPGITGRWQSGDRNMSTFSDGSRQKIELSYVCDASLKEDIRIFFETISAMFIRRSGK